MFFKKAINPDQFEFATIISTGQLYQRLGRMPTFAEIEDQVLNLVKEFGGKLNSQQMQVLKMAAPRLCFSDSETLIKRMVSEGAQTDGKAYAGLVQLLQSSSIRFC